MPVISVRLSDEDAAWLQAHGHKPGQFAREAIQEDIRRREIEDTFHWLNEHRIRGGPSTQAILREDRGR